MENVRLVEAPISISFDEVSDDNEAYEREYHQMSESDDDPIAQWLKLAKARGDTQESDPVILSLLIELHRKIDSLEALIKNEKPNRVDLKLREDVGRIGFMHFELKSAVLKKGMNYYGRVEMPTYPSRDIGIFFIAEDENLAKITRIHQRDEKEWGSYVTARERVMIREKRAHQ